MITYDLLKSNYNKVLLGHVAEHPNYFDPSK